ncbi:hypothetical protein L6164_025980 [Bauhinia variegata]|uniref:Uncharacterized protein n=1 Tax=Bauhinia variegata TaxID=167791 RepID=A0ACB9M283_BAUVA|nr:hypothetical protein L6164_025980 [Bauhinia variegata]
MTLGSLGGGGGVPSGVSTNESKVSNVKVMGRDYLTMSPSEASSYNGEAELELGLGLSLGRAATAGGKAKASAWGDCGRILTAKDFPSVVSHGAASLFSERVGGTSIGTKRAADSVSQEGGSPTGSQVVGWPPIRAYRMNSLINQAKTQRAEEDKSSDERDNPKDDSIAKSNHMALKEKANLGFVKVNMDGIRIGRKVDLNSHSSYETLAQTLEDMFFRPATANQIGGEKEQATKPSKLLDGTSEFVLTYEDKEGDWMLVGDVPWRMFLSSVRRLRIMRTSEANGLAPRFQEKNEKQRNKPI